MPSEQLLPCPFCGATFEMATRDDQPAFWITHYSECYIASTKGNRHQWVLTRGIRKWNQRAVPPAPVVPDPYDLGEVIASLEAGEVLVALDKLREMLVGIHRVAEPVVGNQDHELG